MKLSKESVNSGQFLVAIIVSDHAMSIQITDLKTLNTFVLR